MRAYYEARAAEYDDWCNGTGQVRRPRAARLARGRPRPDRRVGGLPPARTLDVACGTAFLGRHLPGEITAIDQSPGMVAIAASRMPGADVARGGGRRRCRSPTARSSG